MKQELSAIIPVHNEDKTINQVIDDLKNELYKLDLDFEIIVVNDASTDKSREVIEKISGIRILHHSTNKGYGASLKTGIKEARFNNLLFFDADGQHKTEHISEMIKHVDDFDLISGARIGYKGPVVRQPGKKILQWLAQYLSKQKIPDLNCGLRIVKKDKISKFLHLLCNEFSFSTTTLLMFASEELPIKYVPITINKREGGSKVRPKHAMDTLIYILRTILLTNPLRIFLPISIVLFIATIVSGAYDIFARSLNLTDQTIILFVAFLFMFFFGLLADQTASIKRDLKNNYEK